MEQSRPEKQCRSKKLRLRCLCPAGSKIIRRSEIYKGYISDVSLKEMCVLSKDCQNLKNFGQICPANSDYQACPNYCDHDICTRENYAYRVGTNDVEKSCGKEFLLCEPRCVCKTGFWNGNFISNNQDTPPLHINNRSQTDKSNFNHFEYNMEPMGQATQSNLAYCLSKEQCAETVCPSDFLLVKCKDDANYLTCDEYGFLTKNFLTACDYECVCTSGVFDKLTNNCTTAAECGKRKLSQQVRSLTCTDCGALYYSTEYLWCSPILHLQPEPFPNIKIPLTQWLVVLI